MKQHVLKLAVIGTMAVSITACTAGRTDNTQQQGVRPHGVNRTTHQHMLHNRSNNYTSRHNNTRLEMSQEIADRIANMKEVDTANVLLTDKNAYVAVVLNHMETSPENHNHLGNKSNLNNTNSTSNTRHTDRNGTMNQSALHNDPDAVTDVLKNRIADQVRKLHPNLRNVYVSANPDFVQRMNGYADQFRSGHPLRGLTMQFNTMVDRLFPQNSGTIHSNQNIR